jgi:hypothetical protein
MGVTNINKFRKVELKFSGPGICQNADAAPTFHKGKIELVSKRLGA